MVQLLTRVGAIALVLLAIVNAWLLWPTQAGNKLRTIGQFECHLQTNQGGRVTMVCFQRP